ncbi:hypothetical protein ACIBI9_22110 [Nonomuraea sp. NPDC050451]|uniref:hypothetical protein n=1 Tax=Nonomuraea sp. NPDC050451 TaxID=3364364 RepID=UPI00378B8993
MTEDRNELINDNAEHAFLGAVASRGDRGSQRYLQLVHPMLQGGWRSSSGVAGGRNDIMIGGEQMTIPVAVALPGGRGSQRIAKGHG